MDIQQVLKTFGNEGISLSKDMSVCLEAMPGVVHPDVWLPIAFTLYSAKLIERSLAKHADALVKSAEASNKYTAALVKSAEASERHAKGLTCATVALVVATVALVVVTYLTYHSAIVR